MKKIVNGELLDMTPEEIATLSVVQNVPVERIYPPLSKAAFWLAALDLGVKKEDVQAHVTLIQDEYQREQMRILLEETATYRRESPMVELFSTILGIPEQQINDVWLWAAESSI